jgi:endonuclease-3
VASTDDLSEIGSRLAEHYGRPRWRRDLDPLGELIQSVIGQHTSGPNSRRAFERLLARFPTWKDLAEAAVEDIAQAIASAGLARQKAPRIKAIVGRVVDERPDADLSFLARMPIPAALAWLERLPGVGPTTAACALLFGLDVPAFPVDTGILRVARRLGLVAPTAPARETQRLLQATVPAEDVYALHVNLIHFSRDLCTSGEPLCAVCPLNDLCAYFRSFHAA